MQAMWIVAVPRICAIRLRPGRSSKIGKIAKLSHRSAAIWLNAVAGIIMRDKSRLSVSRLRMNEKRSNENRCYKLPCTGSHDPGQSRFRGSSVPRHRHDYNDRRIVRHASRLSSPLCVRSCY